MKKFLLSLAVMLGVSGMASAASITLPEEGKTWESYTWEQVNGTDYKATIAGYEFLLAKGSSTQALASPAAEIRVFANANLTITATTGAKFKTVTVTVASGSKAVATTAKPTAWTVPASITTTANSTYSYTAASEQSTITFDGSGKQIRVAKLVISTDGEQGGETPDVPTPPAVDTEGKGTAESPYTVADVIKLNNPATKAWVKGVIVGSMNSKASPYEFQTTAPFTMASNVYIAAAAGETDQTKMVPVELKSGSAVRTAVNLLDNPGNMNKELAVYGELIAYFNQPGVKTISEYKLDGQGSETPDTPSVPTTGPGSESQPLTVAEAIAKNNDKSLAWVTGYIVGVMNYNETEKKNEFSATDFKVNANIVIAATPSDYGDAIFSVQLPAGELRDLNLVDRPGNLGKEVSVCGSLEKYCGVNGMKNTSKYTIVGGLAPIPVKEISSLTALIEEDDTQNFYKITSPVTVYYQSPDKKYTFITDGTSNIEVYTGAGLNNAYTNGDQLTGVIGKYAYYQNMPQLTPEVDSFGAATAGTAVEPTKVTLDKVMIAQYVTVEDVEIVATEADGKITYTVTDGTTTKTLFDRFAIGNIKADSKATITGIGAIYGETQQIFPISIQYGESSISEINAAAEGSAVIFNLQGRRLAAPVKGINIINGKKVLVK